MKNREEGLDMIQRAVKVTDILRENVERKLSILCPFNKNCHVTSRTCIYPIFKSHVIQNQVKRGTLIKLDRVTTENIIFLLPWQYVRFQVLFYYF